MMFFIKYLIWFSILNVFYVTDADPNVPVLYAQDYCHYTTINHEIKVNEDQPSIIIRANRNNYKPDLDCQLRVLNKGAAKNKGLNININYINLRKFHSFRDYLVIKFDKKQTNLWYDRRPIDNNYINEEFFLTEESYNPEEVTIKFQTTANNNDSPREDKDFEIVITLFDRRESDDPKDSRSCERRNLFDCGDNVCIQRRFFCNGVDNCGNGRDEPNKCKHSRNNNYFDLFDNGFWFGFKIVMSLLLIGFLLGIISCICKKCDENKKIKKQFLLDELNRHSGYRLRGNSIYSLNKNKTPLYPQLYRTYGGTEA